MIKGSEGYGRDGYKKMLNEGQGRLRNDRWRCCIVVGLVKQRTEQLPTVSIGPRVARVRAIRRKEEVQTFFLWVGHGRTATRIPNTFRRDIISGLT